MAPQEDAMQKQSSNNNSDVIFDQSFRIFTSPITSLSTTTSSKNISEFASKPCLINGPTATCTLTPTSMSPPSHRRRFSKNSALTKTTS
ncbi:hypothetical protein HID58_095880 [Brassica napus]|uniref:Uncharacterized protein n=1 Tax=Brassica napus TaxID=3708 RepID=A0ABQ7X4B1_BRANA|nr:hypothetical protein HID58_095880 [Brassica napus]